MTLKKIITLFFKTLLVGLLASVVIGTITQLMDGESEHLTWSVYLYYILAGMTFSVLSQMGFFAYLTINYIARSLFKRRFIWTAIQVILIIVVFVDLIVLRYTFFEEHHNGLVGYFTFPIILLIVSGAIAYWKQQLTRTEAFIPTLFFMFAVTSLEAVPALRENNPDATLFMIVPLVLCNAYQILVLHKLVKPSQQAK